MTVADPLTYTVQITVSAEQFQKLTTLATRQNFATVEAFLVSHALGMNSTYAPPADVVSEVAFGSIQQPTDEPEAEVESKTRRGKRLDGV